MSDRANHPSLEDLQAMAIGEIALLPVDQLALLQEDAKAALTAAKAVAERIAGALALRYAERAQAERRARNKDTGTVRFEDGDVTVVADLPKRVDWDQDRLAGILERIRATGDDPTQYVDVAIKVPERKYAAWPDAIRGVFEPARTVRTGVLKVELLPQGGEI